MVTLPTQSYWSRLARAYSQVGPPLRPSREDIEYMEKTVAAWAGDQSGTQFRVLMLGVTPDIADMRWPDSTTLVAADRALAMTQVVWPGDIPKKRRAVCASWEDLPLADGSFDLVLGDGALNCVRYPAECRDLLGEASRVLGDGGLLVLRCYVQPPAQERPEEVIASIFDKPDPTFHHLKFRLLMAMQTGVGQGTVVDDVYRFWAGQSLDTVAVAARTGWELASIDTIEMYRGTNTVHTFPNQLELETLLSEFFEVVSIGTPYLETCPVWVLRPRRAGKVRQKEEAL